MDYEKLTPLEEDDLIAEIKKDFKHDRIFSADWRKDARENYDFVALRQWSQEDLTTLDEQKRPAITFDYTQKVVNAICGAEVNNRQQVRYAPREMSDVKVNEVLTAAGDWVRDQCQAEDEESDAFRDLNICGMGWTETSLDYEEDPDGQVKINRRDPLKCWWDGAASKKNIRDARRVYYGDWMSKEDIERQWPDADLADVKDDLMDEAASEHNADQAWQYKNDQNDQGIKNSGMLFVLQKQCFKMEPFYRVEDPDTKKLISIPEERFTQLKKIYEDSTGTKLNFVKQTKKVFYRAYSCGEVLLEYKKSPCQTGFTLNCMTGRRDRNTNYWMGIVQGLKDPNRWGNKFFSQILHIINSNAKGGAFAETGAFADPKKAEQQWAEASPLLLLKEGGIDKIRDRQPAGFPAGLDRLMEFAFNAGPMVSGINLEALGLANRDQPGVLESQRKQSAYAMVADLFDSMRLYRKTQGKVLLEYIQKYISDGRLMRVLGPEGNPQVVALSKQPDDVTYDVIVDDAPHAPDQKQKTWEMLVQLLPTMMKQGMPIPPDLLDFSPLPSTLVEKWKAYIQQSKGVPPELQQQMDQMQQQLQQASQQNQKLTMENMQLKFDGAVEMMQLQQKAAAQTQNSAIKEKAINADSYNRQMEMMTKAAIDKLAIFVDAKIKDMKIAVEGHAKLLDHGVALDKAKSEAAASRKEDVQQKNDIMTRLTDTIKSVTESQKEISQTLKKKKKLTLKRTKDGFVAEQEV